MKSETATTTCIRVRRDVLAAMQKLAQLKRAQRGGFGRASVSAMLSDLAVSELDRYEAEAKKRKGADA